MAFRASVDFEGWRTAISSHNAHTNRVTVGSVLSWRQSRAIFVYGDLRRCHGCSGRINVKNEN
jgi:NADH dehydrogenase FAD-containing subunit